MGGVHRPMTDSGSSIPQLTVLLSVISMAAVLRTRHHQGLAYLVNGWDLRDDRQTSIDPA